MDDNKEIETMKLLFDDCGLNMIKDQKQAMVNLVTQSKI